MSLTRVHNRMIEGAEGNPRDYGAVGDGVTDDSAAFNLCAANNSVIVIDSPLYIPTGVVTGSDKKIIGNGGKIKNSPLRIDVENANNLVIENLYIEYDSVTTGKHGLVFGTSEATSIARDIYINNLHVLNADYCIYIEPSSAYEFHELGLWKISNSKLQGNVGVKYSAAILSGPEHAVNDHLFVNNIFYANEYSIDIVAIDGLTLTGNTFFPTTNIKSHINGEYYYQLLVNGNQIFECDEEAILITKLKNGVISNNNFVGSCRVKLCNAIDLDLFGGDTKTVVANNSFNGGCVNFVDIKSTTASGSEHFGSVTGNQLFFSLGTREGTDLSTIDRYSLNVASAIGTRAKFLPSENSAFEDGGSNPSRPINVYPFYLAKRTGDVKLVEVTTDASGVAYILDDAEMQRIEEYSIDVRFNTLTNSNAASYQITAFDIATGYSVSLINEGGMTAGNPGWPGFTFTRDATGLKATHKAGASGGGQKYFFYIENE